MLYNENWSESIKLKVWQKAKEVPGNDPNIYRKDFAGAWIKYEDYGKNSSDKNFGWEIDHKIPESKGGSDDLSNLEPLQWCNNRTKGNDYPRFKTSISSDGTHNTYKEQSWEFNT